MGRRRPKSLVLILARELATNLATPVFIVDAEGIVVFYNEPAEEMLGRTFAEAGAIPADDFRAALSPQSLDGRALPVDVLPSAVAFRERRPDHSNLRITGLDGVTREVSATGLPLFARGREFVGVVTIFWQRGSEP